MNRLSAVLACLAAAMAAALPALAQEALPTSRQAMAQLVHQAMVPSSMASYGYRWDAVSIRISRHMHWHLVGPDEPRGKSPDGIRRNGWVDAKDASVSVSAHGMGENVEILAFEFGGWRSTSKDDDAIAALKAAGVTATPRPSPQNPAAGILGVDSSAAWDLAADGREPARLTRDTICTPPGSAAARRCSAVYELVLKR